MYETETLKLAYQHVHACDSCSSTQWGLVKPPQLNFGYHNFVNLDVHNQ